MASHATSIMAREEGVTDVLRKLELARSEHLSSSQAVGILVDFGL